MSFASFSAASTVGLLAVSYTHLDVYKRQAQYIPKILGKILQKGLLSGPWVSENGGQSEFPQEVVSSLLDGHLAVALLVAPRFQDFGLVVFAHPTSPYVLRYPTLDRRNTSPITVE